MENQEMTIGFNNVEHVDGFNKDSFCGVVQTKA